MIEDANTVSEAFRKATEGMIHSYSKKAYPWDNACIESFHALLKREWINRFKIFNYTHAYKLVFEYIETFYNTVRIHSHCGYLSPNEYEEEYQKNLKMNVTKLPQVNKNGTLLHRNGRRNHNRRFSRSSRYSRQDIYWLKTSCVPLSAPLRSLRPIRNQPVRMFCIAFAAAF